MDRGDPEELIAQDHFGSWVRYHRGFREYKRLRQLYEVRTWKMEIICYIGPSGTGKSRKAFETYPQAYWGPKGKWWDGYCGQETVVVDEMYGHRFSFSELLQLLDRYPFQVETKGGVVQFTSRRIVFTSNQDPQDWYNAERTHNTRWEENPLNRRLREYGTIYYTGEVHRVAGERSERANSEAGSEVRGPVEEFAGTHNTIGSPHLLPTYYTDLSGFSPSPQYVPSLNYNEVCKWDILGID